MRRSLKTEVYEMRVSASIEPLRGGEQTKRKRYSVGQIIGAIKQHELGTPAGDTIRKLGVAEVTFYRWKLTFLSASEISSVSLLG